MKLKSTILWLAVITATLALALPCSVSAQSGGGETLYFPVVINFPPPQRPTLKWAYGGCYSSWCETGWYSSPAVINIDGDSQAEVIASAYTLWALDGLDGAEQWRYDSPDEQRTWPGIVLADLTNDGETEIVIAQMDGYVTVLDLAGNVIWRNPVVTHELRSLVVADLDGNGGNREIVVGVAKSTSVDTYVLNANGSIRSGWPQITSPTSGYAAGIFNNNIAAANISGDAALELIIPTDMHYILGLKPDGTPLAANSSVYPGRGVWGLVGVWENLATEVRGWGACEADQPRSENNRPNFAASPATIADVNGDGSLEIVVIGNVHDCSGYDSATDSYPSQYYGPFIFNADRTRFNSGGFDWRSTPVDTGAPLNEDYDVIKNVRANPVVVDLDGDGRKEILFASYDGRLHAFWLDKSEHGSWPYTANTAAGIEYASEPVVADLDNNGSAEVLFTTWPEKDSGRWGRLVMLSADGSLLHSVNLPAARGDDWSGGLPAPTLANVDQDADLEIVILTAQAGVVVYDLPYTANARILWQTGRGSYSRQGVALP